MKISVVVNPEGEIVGAAIPSEPRTVAGPSSTDEFKLPEGHTRHELSMPPELAKDFLDGRFAETFPHYKLVEETGEIALKRA
jgi:hypothetical protein